MLAVLEVLSRVKPSVVIEVVAEREMAGKFKLLKPIQA
jgi:hypothetical protein